MESKREMRREQAARITNNGMDCNVLAERVHLPLQWPEIRSTTNSLLDEHLKEPCMRPDCSRSLPHAHTSHPPLPEALRAFHCREVSKPTTASQRAEREAMKREAQRQREQAARITSYGLDCNVLSDRKHIPISWPLESPATANMDDLVATGGQHGRLEATSNSLIPGTCRPNLNKSSNGVTAVPLVSRAFHCQGISKPIATSQRTEREAMKRKAQRQREQAARITSYGLDCNVLADQNHIPFSWPPESPITTVMEGLVASGAQNGHLEADSSSLIPEASCSMDSKLDEKLGVTVQADKKSANFRLGKRAGPGSLPHTHTPHPSLPGAPRGFHCKEASKPISPSQRQEREAVKREAQRQRMEGARITRNGKDCSVLSEREHLPVLWPSELQLTTAMEDLVAKGEQHETQSISQLPETSSSSNALDEDLRTRDQDYMQEQTKKPSNSLKPACKVQNAINRKQALIHNVNDKSKINVNLSKKSHDKNCGKVMDRKRKRIPERDEEVCREYPVSKTKRLAKIKEQPGEGGRDQLGTNTKTHVSKQIRPFSSAQRKDPVPRKMKRKIAKVAPYTGRGLGRHIMPREQVSHKLGDKDEKPRATTSWNYGLKKKTAVPTSRQLQTANPRPPTIGQVGGQKMPSTGRSELWIPRYPTRPCNRNPVLHKSSDGHIAAPIRSGAQRANQNSHCHVRTSVNKPDKRCVNASTCPGPKRPMCPTSSHLDTRRGPNTRPECRRSFPHTQDPQKAPPGASCVFNYSKVFKPLNPSRRIEREAVKREA